MKRFFIQRNMYASGFCRICPGTNRDKTWPVSPEPERDGNYYCMGG